MDYSSFTKKLFLYEHAAAQWNAIAAAVTEDSGFVALQGHGAAHQMQACGGAYESSAFFADFLHNLKGKTVVKYVVSFGCRTGQTFVEELQTALNVDFPNVVVSGPLQPLVMDCGGHPNKGNGRIFADGNHALKFGAAIKLWGELWPPFQLNLAGKVAAFWVERQAAAAEVKADDAVAKTRTLVTKLAQEYTPLWKDFITKCDAAHLLYPAGDGWITRPSAFLFRQVMPKSKAARTRRHPQLLQPAQEAASQD